MRRRSPTLEPGGTPQLTHPLGEVKVYDRPTTPGIRGRLGVMTFSLLLILVALAVVLWISGGLLAM